MNPSEQSIEVRQQILDTLWLTEELLETPAHISITSNDINRLVALVDKATREAARKELLYLRRQAELALEQGSSITVEAVVKVCNDRIKALEELSNKEPAE